MNVVIEELKQRITAIAAKVRRYQGRVDSYRQFYRELDQEEERCEDDQPVAEESKQFWGNICRRVAKVGGGGGGEAGEEGEYSPLPDLNNFNFALNRKKHAFFDPML